MQNHKKINDSLFDFIDNCPTAYHTIESTASTLKQNGFQLLDEKVKWQIENGGKYYVLCGASSLIAFTMPKKDFDGYHIVATHSDSPCFKIKTTPEIKSENAYTTLNVAAYGGMLLAPWFDRPLSVAGRVVLNKNGKIEVKLLDFNKDLISIVNIAPHLGRENANGKELKVQSDMFPIFSAKNNDITLNKLIATELCIDENEILSHDLFVYNRMSGTTWGANSEFISAPRLDNLQCTFAAINALKSAQHENKISMLAVFDSEEVGSGTMQGAKSTFLKHTIERIALCFGKTSEEIMIAISNSSMVSADNGHAVHPNYSDKADKTNRPILGGGVLIKYSANMRYTTDAIIGGAMRLICEKADVPHQIYHNNSNIAGGSTLGNISLAQVSLPCADIGIAMLAMHSPYETAGSADTAQLIDFMSEYYNTDVI